MAVIRTVSGKTPSVGEDTFLAETAAITGEVTLHDGVSVFYGVSVRGDSAPITVGRGTNLQDNVVLHADVGSPCTLGENVSVGHTAVVHGCSVGDGSLIGMSATVMNGAVIGEQCLVAAGALVLEGTEVPPRHLVAGVPAKVRRELHEHEVAALEKNAQTYHRLRDAHREAESGE